MKKTGRNCRSLKLLSRGRNFFWGCWKGGNEKLLWLLRTKQCSTHASKNWEQLWSLHNLLTSPRREISVSQTGEDLTSYPKTLATLPTKKYAWDGTLDTIVGYSPYEDYPPVVFCTYPCGYRINADVKSQISAWDAKKMKLNHVRNSWDLTHFEVIRSEICRFVGHGSATSHARNNLNSSKDD
jgi:hypothetical protein